LPPVSLTVSDSPNTFTKASWQAGAGNSPAAPGWRPISRRRQTDFVKAQPQQLQDRRADLQRQRLSPGRSGPVSGCVATSGTAWVVGDFNGDGKPTRRQLSASPLTGTRLSFDRLGIYYQKFINATGDDSVRRHLAGRRTSTADGKTDLISNRSDGVDLCDQCLDFYRVDLHVAELANIALRQRIRRQPFGKSATSTAMAKPIWLRRVLCHRPARR